MGEIKLQSFGPAVSLLPDLFFLLAWQNGIQSWAVIHFSDIIINTGFVISTIPPLKQEKVFQPQLFFSGK